MCRLLHLSVTCGHFLHVDIIVKRRYSGVPKDDAKRLVLSEEYKLLSSRRQSADTVMRPGVNTSVGDMTAIAGTVGYTRIKEHLET